MKNQYPTPAGILRTALFLGLLPLAAQAETWNAGDGNWSTGTNWAGGTPPVSDAATALVFAASGAASYTATNDIGSFTLNSLTVNNIGTGVVSLTGSVAANTFVFGGTDPVINVSSGTALFLGLMNGSATITKTGGGTFIHDSNNNNTGNFNGTLIVNGGTFANEATVVATTNFNPVSIVVNNGGIYRFGNAAIGNPNIPNSTYITVNPGGNVVWQEGEDFGGIILKGGTIDGNTGALNLAGAAASEFQSGTINGPSNFGGAAGINKTTAGTVTVNGSALNNTTALNIQEGTLVTNTGFASAGAMTLGTAGNSATLSFNGASATNARALTVNAGGGTVNVISPGGVYTQSLATALTGNLTKTGDGTYVISGATSGSGGVTVNGGELSLTSAPGFSGTSQVNAGATLRVAPGATASTSAVSLGAGGTLAVSGGAGTASFTAPSVSLAAGGSTLKLDLNAPSAPTAPLLVVKDAGGLNLNGGNQTLLVRNAQPFGAGTFTALDYNGTAITSGFTLDLGRQVGSIVYNTAATSIDVQTTGVTDTTRWGGQGSAAWDVGTAVNVGGTQNWKLNSNNASTNFIDLDSVTFDDTAAGNFDVKLDTTAQTGGVRFNNTTAYTLSGTGGITGSGALVKDGTGPATLSTVNTYSGGTTVNAGTLAISGSGSIAGPVLVNNGGTLSIVNQTSLATASTIGLDGGKLVINANYAGGANQVLNFGAGGGTVEVADGVLATKNGAAFTGSGTFNKTGTGTLSIQSGGGATITGAVNINQGTLRFTSSRLTASDTVTVNSGGTLLVLDSANYNAATPFVAGLGKSLVLNGDGHNGAGAWMHTLDEAGSAVLVLDSAVTLASTSRVNVLVGTVGTRTPSDTNTDIFAQPVSGSGGLIKDGNGTLVLAAGNTYTGGTTLNEGTILVNGSTSASSGFTVSGGMLGGTGTIGGSVSVLSGGTLSPGASIESLATGNVSFSAGSTFAYEMTTATVDGDLLESRGNLALSGGVALNLVDLGTSTAVPGGTKLTLISYDGAWNGGTFTGLADDSVLTSGVNQWLINYNDTTGGANQGGGTGSAFVTLTAGAVPEPSSGLLALLAAAGLINRRKR